MKSYFVEEYENASYEFIQDDNIPDKNLITCVFAMLSFNGKIYLTKNRRGWELPGGHVEEGENLDEALDREISEEVGACIKSKRLFGYKKYTNFKKIENRTGGFYPFPHSYILMYIGEATGEDIKEYCPDTLDYGLFTVDEAISKIESNGTRKMIEVMRDFLD